MALKFGPSSINSETSRETPSLRREIVAVRVKDIVLSPNHPRFEEVGGWLGLGTIFYDSLSFPGVKSSREIDGRAKPYFSNSKFYPLINEIVSIISSVDPINSQMPQSSGRETAYYFPPVNSWNNPHHNSLPDKSAGELTSPITPKTYSEVESGQVNRSATQPVSTILGATFKEKDNVYPLYPYEGDNIIEGRWNNSIRLGSTTNFPPFPNFWSENKKEGDPIILIRNGTTITSNQEGWIPTVENLQNDLSSIYLTSTQKIPFFPASFKTDSFGPNDVSLPQPSEFDKNQIILTSGRLVLNAKNEGMLLSSSEVIHLSSGYSINLDCSNKIVLSTGKLYLISRNAEERVVLGKALVRELNKLISALDVIASACTAAVAGPFPVPALIQAGPVLKNALADMKTSLKGKDPKILSKKIYIE